MSAAKNSVQPLVRLLRAYEGRVDYWLAEAEKYRRSTGGRREAVAYANAFCCMVDDIRTLVPAKHRKRSASGKHPAPRTIGTGELIPGAVLKHSQPNKEVSIER